MTVDGLSMVVGKPINSGASCQWLDGGKRLHLQHGPIDLIVEACGERENVTVAYRQAQEVFQTILVDLVDELVMLRQPLTAESERPAGRVARRMVEAALPFAWRGFVTPMVAVAGAVADHVMQAMVRDCSLSRAYVNNGGDIALWLSEGESFTVGICDNTETGRVGSRVTLSAEDDVRGVATSGWRGRSYSLGIADAVTVLAGSAASADAAATIIGNAVDVPVCAGVQRQRAVELSPDSDLGSRLVTVGVDRLKQHDIEVAIDNGRRVAHELMCCGYIESAYISLQGNSRVCSRQAISAGAMHA